MSTGRLFTILGTTLLLWNCGGSSPTQPAPPTPSTGLTIVYQDPAGQLGDARRGFLRERVEDTWELAGRDLSLDGLTVRLTPGPRHLIPGWGVGGFAPNGFEAEIATDPALTEETLARRLPSLAAHEFHHNARSRGPGYGNTLLQAMISEGLADHFAFELFAEPLPPWVTALSDSEIDFWLERARPELGSTGYSHSAWFFGSNGEIPNWAGYAIGFRLVSDYIDAHPGATAASLVNLGASAFRPQ